MRLQAEGLTDAMHPRASVANCLGHAAQAPMRGPGRARLQRSADRLGDLVITNLAWCARSRLVIKSVKPIPGKALAPLPHRAAEDAQSLRYQPVVNPFGRRQHNARAPKPDRSSDAAPATPALAALPLTM